MTVDKNTDIHTRGEGQWVTFYFRKQYDKILLKFFLGYKFFVRGNTFHVECRSINSSNCKDDISEIKNFLVKRFGKNINEHFIFYKIPFESFMLS